MFRMLFWVVLLSIMSGNASASAQTSSPQEIIDATHASFQKATTPEAVESIASWCRGSLAVFSIKEREGLMLAAKASIEKNDWDEANGALKRVKQLDESDKTFADLNCKPTSKDDALRHTLKSK
jgi:asparagine synthetase A